MLHFPFFLASFCFFPDLSKPPFGLIWAPITEKMGHTRLSINKLTS